MIRLDRRRSLLIAFALLGCNSSESLRYVDESRIVATMAGTCGEWDITTANPATITHVTATCGDGMVCGGWAWATLQPADMHGRAFKICLSADSLSCQLPAQPCPQQLSCLSGYGVPSTGACLLTCKTDLDCPDDYQVCFGELCRFLACPLPDEDAGGSSCLPGSTCSDGICRANRT